MRPQIVLGLAFAALLTESCVAGVIIPYGDPGSSKAISSEATLAATIAQLQQRETRVQAFLALLDFANAPKSDPQRDDPQLDRMQTEAVIAYRRCPDLDGVIETMIRNVDVPNHRLKMISALRKFAGPGLFSGSTIMSTGDQNVDVEINRAAQVPNQAADVKTVTEALADPELRGWAVSKFGNSLGRTEDWLPLLPQEEAVAEGNDQSLRGAAVAPLAHFPGTGKFLDERFAIEKSPLILMGLLHNRGIDGDEFNRRFLPRLDRLLSDDDESVRNDALWYISATYCWAECYRLPFGRDAFDLVIRATKSTSAKERANAIDALRYLRDIDQDASRGVFLRLLNDSDENVRCGVGECLAVLPASKQVQQGIDALLQDKSSVVRYRTIDAIGPRKFMPQLEELARGTNRQVAGWASEDLKRMSETMTNSSWAY